MTSNLCYLTILDLSKSPCFAISTPTMACSQVMAVPRIRSFGQAGSCISNQRLFCPPSYRRLIGTTSPYQATISREQGTHYPSTDGQIEETRPQTLTEKIIQSHSVGLPEGKRVRSGDYVQISK